MEGRGVLLHKEICCVCGTILLRRRRRRRSGRSVDEISLLAVFAHKGRKDRFLRPRRNKIELPCVVADTFERSNATWLSEAAGFEVDAQSMEEVRRDFLGEVVADESQFW